MSTWTFYLALVLFTSISQSAPPVLPTPTHDRAPTLHKRSLIPSDVVVVAPLPAPVCPLRNNESNVQTSTKSFQIGEQWLPGLPWNEPGQVVFVSTDTDGVEFENLAFYKAPPVLNNSRSLLQLYSNSSGWSMTMPSTVNYNRKSRTTLPPSANFLEAKTTIDQSVHPHSHGQRLPRLERFHRTIWG